MRAWSLLLACALIAVAAPASATWVPPSWAPNTQLTTPIVFVHGLLGFGPTVSPALERGGRPTPTDASPCDSR